MAARSKYDVGRQHCRQVHVERPLRVAYTDSLLDGDRHVDAGLSPPIVLCSRHTGVGVSDLQVSRKMGIKVCS